MINKIAITLPFPPTVNNYWLQVGKRRTLTKEARDYKIECFTKILEFKKSVPEEFKLALKEELISRHLIIYPPDRRRRDGTNLEKAVDDALVYGGLITDDSQIKRWSGEMMEPAEDKKGFIIVELAILNSLEVFIIGLENNY